MFNPGDVVRFRREKDLLCEYGFGTRYYIDVGAGLSSYYCKLHSGQLVKIKRKHCVGINVYYELPNELWSYSECYFEEDGVADNV